MPIVSKLEFRGDRIKMGQGVLVRITQFTDYSLRVLLYLGLKGERATVSEINKAFRISRNHLTKVVHHLSQAGYIKSFKGKAGGIQLARDPKTIRVGEFVAEIEPLDLLECFNPKTNTCPIQGVCRLEHVLHAGAKSFLDSLNQHTLADFLVPSPSRDARLARLGLTQPKS
jgi:Rrf2 family nitric oxide-sensitive transcriptional repressor